MKNLKKVKFTILLAFFSLASCFPILSFLISSINLRAYESMMITHLLKLVVSTLFAFSLFVHILIIHYNENFCSTLSHEVILAVEINNMCCFMCFVSLSISNLFLIKGPPIIYVLLGSIFSFYRKVESRAINRCTHVGFAAILFALLFHSIWFTNSLLTKFSWILLFPNSVSLDCFRDLLYHHYF